MTLLMNKGYVNKAYKGIASQWIFLNKIADYQQHVEYLDQQLTKKFSNDAPNYLTNTKDRHQDFYQSY